MALETERSRAVSHSNGGLAGLKRRRERQPRLRSQGPAGASSQTSRAAGSAATLATAAAGGDCDPAPGPSHFARPTLPHSLEPARTRKASAPIERWFRRQPIVRFFSASLLRRILVSNLMGFFILLGGILYLGWFHTWLIDAKLDALKTQGKIIADAIAANATVVRERIVLDPNKPARHARTRHSSSPTTALPRSSCRSIPRKSRRSCAS